MGLTEGRVAAFCRDPSNTFDTILVIASSVQIYVLDPLSVNAVKNVTVFRILRLGRSIRVLRLIRVFKHFAELRVLLLTLISSAWALIWSMVFLFVIMMISALFICYSLKDALVDETIEHSFRLWLYKY